MSASDDICQKFHSRFGSTAGNKNMFCQYFFWFYFLVNHKHVASVCYQVSITALFCQFGPAVANLCCSYALHNHVWPLNDTASTNPVSSLSPPGECQSTPCRLFPVGCPPACVIRFEKIATCFAVISPLVGRCCLATKRR